MLRYPKQHTGPYLSTEVCVSTTETRDNLYIQTLAYFIDGELKKHLEDWGSSFALSTAGFISSSSPETWRKQLDSYLSIVYLGLNRSIILLLVLEFVALLDCLDCFT